MPIEQLEAWESGEQKISLSEGKKLAHVYKVSLPLLYLQNIPDEWHVESPKDFRRADLQQAYSYQLCVAIHAARMRQSWMREYLMEEGQEPLSWLGSFSSQNEHESKAIADWVVQWLDIDRQHIEALADSKEALFYWAEKFEARGIIVSTNQTHAAYKIDRDEYSGLVLYDDYAPLTLLNPADSPARRIFTLVHELAHLLLERDSSVSQISFRHQDEKYAPVEAMCNDIASRVLIEDEQLSQIQQNNGHDFMETIDALAERIKTSRSAIAVALKKREIIDQDTLHGLLDEYAKLYQESQKDKGFGRTIPEKVVLDRCGELLTRTVLTAYEQGSIDATEIYDILGMKLKHLSALSGRLKFPLHRWVA